jgi:hypothetical protein
MNLAVLGTIAAQRGGGAPVPPAAYDAYVATAANGGSDSNDGLTPETPKETIPAGIAVVEGLGGGTLKIGTGTFTSDEYLVLENVSLVGDGVGNTILKLDSSLNHTFVPFNYSEGTYMIQIIAGMGVTLSDFSMEGNSRGVNGGIYVNAVDDIVIANLALDNFGFTGIYMRNTTDGSVTDVTLANCSLSTTFSTGAVMIGGATVSRVIFTNVTSDELTVGSIRGYNFKVFGPSPTSPTLDEISLINFVGTTSATSNFGGGTPNIGIEIHNTTITDVLIQGGSSNATMSLVRPSAQVDLGNHTITVDGHNIDAPNGAGMELTFMHVIVKNCYLTNARFAGIFNTDTYGPAANDWLIYNNVFKDMYTSGGQAGAIRSTNYGFLNMNVYNNTFHWTSASASGTRVLVTFSGVVSSGVNFKNKMVIDEADTTVLVQNGGGSISGSTFSYNQFYGLPEGSVSGVTYSNNLTTDPIIIGSGDQPDPYYRPDTGSPCIESGTDVGLPYTGSAPTRGAYEAL